MTQSAFYKAYGGGAPANYERYFVPSIGAPLSAELIEAAALRPGERVLDVACGTGFIARLAAERVGPAGAVTGLDLNPGMLAVARLPLPHAQAHASPAPTATPDNLTIDWIESDAASIPLDDGAIDIVLCQLGLQFMMDKPAALREMRRVLAPAGRIALTVTGPTPSPFTILADALGRHISAQMSAFVHAVFSLHDSEELQALLTDAGFRDVSVQTYTRNLTLPPPKDFLWQYIHSTPLANAVAQADDQTHAELEQEVVTAWRSFVEDDAMTVSPRMLLATARK